ncbi:Retinoblastoma-like protein 1 [Datura stramonium]|uniref:RHOMBOID-like protein n=1 Tax=Datura stramonium TaxID=4076 RepID=A0ABS8TN39_DATST|nr:Retinoblastoma-like protein 1 [Datura stramonium]
MWLCAHWTYILVFLVFGGSILSSRPFIRSISVGASGALFGLLGAMLSELITNWSIYTNKVCALLTLLVIVAVNLAVGILPHVDNFAHIGGFLTGFLLGFSKYKASNRTGAAFSYSAGSRVYRWIGNAVPRG